MNKIAPKVGDYMIANQKLFGDYFPYPLKIVNIGQLNKHTFYYHNNENGSCLIEAEIEEFIPKEIYESQLYKALNEN